MRRTVFWVRWSRPLRAWYVTRGRHIVRGGFDRKEAAVSFGIVTARAHQPSQLRICRRDGAIMSERTYGADPERFAG